MKRFGYTITEFLVIVAFLVLIVSLGVPALHYARMASRSSQCQSNLRQMGLGLLVHADRDPPKPSWTGTGAYGSAALQDTRGWRCHHQGVCNILVADGSVREFRDVNQDGLLNPGFPISSQQTPPSRPAQAGDIGYANAREDLPRGRIFSGIKYKNIAQSKIHRFSGVAPIAPQMPQGSAG
jgi:hypothetical protein